ncbi:MAG TPA: hypothetical protein VK039_01450 [Brevibacterium sp.]|nr:hypothetical protein [Brevibacterium sp.]
MVSLTYPARPAGEPLHSVRRWATAALVQRSVTPTTATHLVCDVVG